RLIAIPILKPVLYPVPTSLYRIKIRAIWRPLDRLNTSVLHLNDRFLSYISRCVVLHKNKRLLLERVKRHPPWYNRDCIVTVARAVDRAPFLLPKEAWALSIA